MPTITHKDHTGRSRFRVLKNPIDTLGEKGEVVKVYQDEKIHQLPFEPSKHRQVPAINSPARYALNDSMEFKVNKDYRERQLKRENAKRLASNARGSKIKVEED